MRGVASARVSVMAPARRAIWSPSLRPAARRPVLIPRVLATALVWMVALTAKSTGASGEQPAMLLDRVEEIVWRFRDTQGDWREEWTPSQPDLLDRKSTSPNPRH